MLKRGWAAATAGKRRPVAFRRLCVETFVPLPSKSPHGPVAFRRLCVETSSGGGMTMDTPQSPLGGCVLKRQYRPHSLF